METPEEFRDMVIDGIRECHMVDNGDGTITMNFVMIQVGERKEYSAVFEANMGDWFAEVFKVMSSSEEVDRIVDTATLIPNSPEEV